MRRPLRVVIDLVQGSSAAADVVGRCIRRWWRRLRRSACPCSMISTQMRWPRRNRLAVAMISIVVFGDFARRDFFCACAGQRCHGFHGRERFRIERAMRGLEPAPCQFALRQIFRDFALALAHGAHRDVRSDVLERSRSSWCRPDRSRRTGSAPRGPAISTIFRQRVAQIAQALHPVGLRRRHLHERVGRQFVLARSTA